MKIYYVLALFAVLGAAMAAPSLQVSYEVTPESINPGGSARVIVSIANADLLVDVEDMEVSLKSLDYQVYVTSPNADVGTITALSSSSAAFGVKAKETATPGTYIFEAKGTYEYGATGSTGTFKINVPIIVSYRSGLEISAGDTSLVAGATTTLPIAIENAGKGEIRDLILSLSSLDTQVYPVGDVRIGVESLPVSETSEVEFRIKASDLATVGIKTLTLTVTYTDAAGETQTDTQSIGVTVVNAGTEVVIDTVESDLEPGKTGKVRIGVSNVGSTNLEKLYFSLRTGTDVTVTTSSTGQPVVATSGEDATLKIRGSNEVMLDSLAVGETKYIEFSFDVAQDAMAFPVSGILIVTYQREGSMNQIGDSKPLGIVLDGSVDLRIVDKTPKASDGEVEIDIANYGNKNADAVKVELLVGGTLAGSSFTDQIKANKHKVFRFDMPQSKDAVVRITYKDYGAAGGLATIEENVAFASSEVNGGGGSGTGIVVLLVIVLVILWYWRHKKKGAIKIDISRYKQG